MISYQDNAAAAFFRGLRPEERLTVSEWADKYRILPPTAAKPGRYKTSETPYLKKIMDCLSTHTSYREVIFMKSAQVGASEAGFNWLGYKMDISPASMLAVMPTEPQMKRNSKTRIEPMIRDTPRLSSKISGSKRDASNTLLYKTFPGGHLNMTGANSASGLRSMPAEAVMLDEADAYPRDLDGEGSPIELAKMRTITFKRAKIFVPSTPTVKGVSVIEKAFEKTDQNKWFVPCPHCGAFQTLEWENMRWVGASAVTSPKTAFYECIHCQTAIYEKHKRRMNASGDWQPTVLENVSAKKIGFHINALVSPWYSWEQCVQQYLEADPESPEMIVFVNTVLGKTSKASGEAPDWQMLQNRALKTPTNKPNEFVKLITLGVDVQGDWLAAHIIGWGHGKRRWVLDYRIIPYAIDTPEGAKALTSLINEVFINPAGVEIPIYMTAIDAGDHPARVYEFCKEFPRDKVVPIKGGGISTYFSNPSAVNKTPAGKKAGNVMLYTLGTDILKSELYDSLRLDKAVEDPQGPNNYTHLIRYEEKYFRGLVAEEERITYTNGIPKKGWHRLFRRNEPLDTMCYARAAASIAGLDRYDDAWLDERAASYVKKSVIEQEEPKTDSLTNNGGSIWD